MACDEVNHVRRDARGEIRARLGVPECSASFGSDVVAPCALPMVWVLRRAVGGEFGQGSQIVGATMPLFTTSIYVCNATITSPPRQATAPRGSNLWAKAEEDPPHRAWNAGDARVTSVAKTVTVCRSAWSLRASSAMR